MELFIDLHMHTTSSDGLSTPVELWQEIRDKNLKAISITDHDTLDGFRAALELRKENDPELISGIELSVAVGEDDLHMLAYFFDPDSLEFNDALVQFQKSRNLRGRQMVQRLRELGCDIQFEQVEKEANGGAIGRPHVAQALYEAKQTSSYEEAFYRYIGNGGSAYIPKVKLEPKETIALVHRAGGITVMAHPYVGNMIQHLEDLIPLGLDGIEVYHYTHSPQQVSQLQHLADRFSLLQTGGSDYHGRERRDGEVGSQRVPAKLLEPMRDKSKEIRRTHC